jgi:hypothetical protein
MRNEVRHLIDVLSEAAIGEETFAQELAELADQYGQRDHLLAEGTRNLSRHHRIRSLHARAQLACLAGQYAHLLGKDS